MQYCVTSDNDIANPPAERAKVSSDRMIEKRKADAKTDSTSVKVRKWKFINVKKKKISFLTV